MLIVSFITTFIVLGSFTFSLGAMTLVVKLTINGDSKVIEYGVRVIPRPVISSMFFRELCTGLRLSSGGLNATSYKS